jgi:Zn ribbon nucleic-acid-binding protein
MVEPKITPTNLIAPIQCPQCSEKGYIIRRWHDPFSRHGSEVWTFQCVNGHHTEKSGRPAPRLARSTGLAVRA